MLERRTTSVTPCNTLLAFYSNNLVAPDRQKCHALGLNQVIQFVEDTIVRVNEVRQREE